MSEMWDRATVIYEMVLEAVTTRDFPQASVDRALAWANNTTRPDIEIELLLGGLASVASNFLTEAAGPERAERLLRNRMTANAVQAIYDDLGPLDPHEDNA